MNSEAGARDIEDDQHAMLARNKLGATGLEAGIGFDDGALSLYSQRWYSKTPLAHS